MGGREAPGVLDKADSGVFIQVSSDGLFTVDEGDGGVVAAPVLPRQEGEEVDIIVSDVPDGGVDVGELEVAAVL